MLLFAICAVILGAIAVPEAAFVLLAQRGILPMARDGAPVGTPHLTGRIACGAALGCIATFLWYALDPLPCLSCVLAATLMEAACLCDLRARVIPWELCAGMLLLGLVCSIASGEPVATLASLALAAALLALIAASNALSSRLHSSPAVGAGDMRLIPALCLFGGVSGSLLGILACSLLMGCAAILALAFGARRDSHVPLAPGLALWFLTGVFSSTPAPVPVLPLILM